MQHAIERLVDRTFAASGSERRVVRLAPEDGRKGTERLLATNSRPYVEGLLKLAGLRLTRHRVALARILFGGGHRHLTAEMLFEEARSSKIGVSLATVYNTLNQFTDLGLLRRIGVDGSKTYFDTNVSEHSHFYLERSHELIDIAESLVVTTREQDIPPGYEVSRIDIVVRLRPRPT